MCRLLKFPLLQWACMLCTMMAGSAFANEIYTGYTSNKAVRGYDTVSYFTEGKPVKGKKKFKVEYLGADWLFSSAKNRALFEADPDKYRPQYGGHCAWAVAANKAKAPGNPKHWKIVDGKLYLNYNGAVQKKWFEDIPGFIAQGDKNWPELSGD